MQSPQNLMRSILLDASLKCSTHTSWQRDFETMSRRLKHEGLSFLTITLPAFLDDFMLSLEAGEVSPTYFAGWRKQGCLPAFLQGFTRLVFNSEGRLENESVTAIHCVRQICSFYKKVKLPCTCQRVNNALQEYVDVDDELQEKFQSIPETELDRFINLSCVVVSTLFPSDIDVDSLIPHHGPGSTEERVVGNKKYNPTNYPWFSRLSRHFSLGTTLYSTDECYYESRDCVETLSSSVPVRVISVPKTLKKPRIIAMEPVSMQMCQQAVKDLVVDRIESCALTKGHVNFTDQTVNQILAMKSSRSRLMATLDMSAASDRIHKDLVYLMLAVNPTLQDLVFSTRSQKASVGGDELFLNKFASMGSALCFPMEALYFFILCIQGILKGSSFPYSLDSIKTAAKQVYVYGDDIIVPTNKVEDVAETLTVFGNVVSQSKSYYKGRFRESCGMDAYNGKNVTPIYLRNLPPTSVRQASNIVSCVSTANQLFKIGFTETANQIVNLVHGCTGDLPVVHESSEGLGWHFDVKTHCKMRYNSRYQRSEVKTLVTQMKKKSDEINGYHALTKCLYKLHRREKSRGDRDWQKDRYTFDQAFFNDERHLCSSPSRGTLTLKRRWVANA